MPNEKNRPVDVPLLRCNWAKLVVDTQFSKQINVFWPLLKEFKARRCEAHGDTQIFATCGRQKSASTAEFSTSTAEKSKRLAENPPRLAHELPSLRNHSGWQL